MAQLKDLIVNGPSRFIGDVYATTFTGNLEGNASTATSATTAAALTGKTLVTASTVTTSNWSTYGNNHIPTMSFIAYWNGAYSGTSSNLTYCKQGTIIGSNNIGSQSVKYATTSGSCSGNSATATKATQDGNGNVITSTYLPLADKGLSNGKVPYYVNFPRYPQLVTLGYNEESTKTSDEAYLKGLCKWAIDNFAGQGQIILIGNAMPNSSGFCYIQLYSSDGKDATTGLPRYCSGTYISLDRVTTNFSCTNYRWTFGGRFYGNAASSSKWATARTITLTGSVTGSVSIDGSANVSLATTTNHTHNYLPLSGGTLTGSLQIGASDNTAYNDMVLVRQGKYIRVNCHGTEGNIDYGTYGSGGTKTSEQSLRFSSSGLSLVSNGTVSRTILHSGNVGNYALPLSGGTLTGSVTMQGMTTNLIRNITYTGTSSWARSLIDLQVDGVHKFGISAFGDYTAGASDNGIVYGYIGCNSYNGLNLRISASSLSWGDSPILHSGNFNSYSPKLDGTGASGTWGINISGNAATATDADKLDGYHKNDILRKTYNPTSTISLNNVVADGIDFTSWDYSRSANINNQPAGDGASSAAGVVSFGTAYPFQIYSDYKNTSLLYYRSFYINTGWKAWRQFAFIDSNVASATKLANSRTIWGRSFDGTGNVSGALTGVTDITASGNVTTTGSIYGQSGVLAHNASGAVLSLNGIPGTSYSYAFYNNSDCGAGVRIVSGRSGATPIVFDSLGNVGIGTTSPSYKLHVVGTAYASGGLVSDGPVKVNESFVVDGTNGSWYGKLNIADEVYILGEDTNINFIESLNIKQHNTTDNTETSIVSIDNSGNITLNVMNDNGGSYEISTSFGSLGIGIPPDDPNLVKTPSFLMSNRGYIYLNARVPSSPNYPLVVNGTIQCTTLSQTSDIKYKSNIKQIEYEEALKIIENLNPVTWDWNENTVETGSSSGFVAQEAEEFIPNAISRDNENNLSLDYTQLHSYEIRVIQEQQKEIIKLKEKLKILENLIS